MRRGWNGVTISRDTIHIDGIELGFKRPVLFERHAVGGEYSAGHATVGPGKVTTTFSPADGSAPVTIVEAELTDQSNAVVTYHNPYDNVTELGRIFFDRCLLHNCTPYVVTKKTVFKWQETYWTKMREVFDAEFKDAFNEAGLLDASGGELQHLAPVGGLAPLEPLPQPPGLRRDGRRNSDSGFPGVFMVFWFPL